MFEPVPAARADLKPGTLYAVTGEAGWIYYGQVTVERKIGLSRRRHRTIAEPAVVLGSAVMSVVTVGYPSIGHALRAGDWRKPGRWAMVPALSVPVAGVNWPAGTLVVTLCEADGSEWDTRVEDSAIQDLEIMAVFNARHHVPARLTLEFGAEPAAWPIGGSVRRERALREEMARRWPDRPEHALPADWVPVDQGLMPAPPGHPDHPRSTHRLQGAPHRLSARPWPPRSAATSRSSARGSPGR